MHHHTRVAAYLVAFTLAGVTGACSKSQKDSTPPGDGPACTEEAKVCPDGSSVARGGPNCEFAECPAAVEGEPAGDGAAAADAADGDAADADAADG